MNYGNLKDRQAKALEAYKAARAKYAETMDKKDWLNFCDARQECMLLGVRIGMI